MSSLAFGDSYRSVKVIHSIVTVSRFFFEVRLASCNAPQTYLWVYLKRHALLDARVYHFRCFQVEEHAYARNLRAELMTAFHHVQYSLFACNFPNLLRAVSHDATQQTLCVPYETTTSPGNPDAMHSNQVLFPWHTLLAIVLFARNPFLSHITWPPHNDAMTSAPGQDFEYLWKLWQLRLFV